MNSNWHPKSSFSYQKLCNETDELIMWKADFRSSSRILLCFFDDQFEEVLNGEYIPSTGSDAWWIRYAIETCLDHPEIHGVVFSSFSRSAISCFLNSVQRFEDFSINCFLDIFVSETKESPGVALGKSLVQMGIIPGSIRPFSNGVSSELEELGIVGRIRKPLNEATTEEKNKFKKEIVSAIDEWVKPFRTAYKTCAGVSELEKIGSCLKKNFHQAFSHQCHEVADCNRNSTVCFSNLEKVACENESIFGDLLASLSQTSPEAILTEDLRNALFLPLKNSECTSISFALSKCLSRFGTEEGKLAVPGYWIGLVLRRDDLGLEQYQYPIKKFRLQPVFGFLHAVLALNKPGRVSNATFNDRKLVLEVNIVGEEGKDLKVLCERAKSIFQSSSRPCGGEWTSLLQTFHDAGANLSRAVLIKGDEELELVFELIFEKVG